MTARDQIVAFLRDPSAFASVADDPEIWLAALEDFAQPALSQPGEFPLMDAQVAAWRGLATARAGLVLGPPGTGKTHLMSWLILGYVQARRASGLPARVFVSGFTRNAIGNVLDSVAKRANAYAPGAFETHFVGQGPAAGLSPLVQHRTEIYGDNAVAALQDLQAPAVVMGGSIWSLSRLMARPEAGGDGFTAELFDLVCIDEASQVVLGHGLMALAGLKPSGRVVVAGDDRQLPPIRAAREVKLGERQLGGSLYTFLKSGNAPEFALDTTFRLNAPLSAFPERKFYTGRYTSAPDVAAERLALIENWREGLDPWEIPLLDPEWPVAILVHDGPPAATRNPFEAAIAARLCEHLADRLTGAKTGSSYAADLWRDRLAIVSPHRAQNAAIRNALSPSLAAGAFVETVDRIQGKERDAVIMSYCVADAEFALAEADFIFAPERLNVATTRAKTKLVVLLSRRLLDAVPGDQEAMDKAEILREFVFNAAPAGDVVLRDPTGVEVRAQIRVSGFGAAPETQEFGADDPEAAQPEPMTPRLQDLLDAVVAEAAISTFRSATLEALAARLARRDDLLPDLSKLHAMGHVALRQPRADYPKFWVATPYDPRRRVFPVDLATLRLRLEEVVAQARQGRSAPFYWRVRDRFAWMDAQGRDVLRAKLDVLRDEGLIAIGQTGDHLTVEWLGADDEPEAGPVSEPLSPLSDDDFRVLNALEDLEAKRINFGVFEAWTSFADLAAGQVFSRTTAAEACRRLADHGWLMLADEERVRSRMAELAREVRQIKQRFDRDDAAQRPYLVRSLKVELRNRDKPERVAPLGATFTTAAVGRSAELQTALAGLHTALAEMWGSSAALAAFQARSLDEVCHAWEADGPDTFVIAADTGSGKTEAGALPLIAAAAADRLKGIGGCRVVMTYPRIRLAANQAQRLSRYLAALAQQPGMPTLTLGLQVSQVPEDLEALRDWDRAAGWAALGADAYSFPLFGCPSCGSDLLLHHGAGVDGADRLVCTQCRWDFPGWIGSKRSLRQQPPTIFLPTTDSLHQWLHDPRYGRLFGDDAEFAPPRAMLADEIHLYSHVHGAQVGYALRRLAARAAVNAPGAPPMLAIGMSATLGDPARSWGRLVGREDVATLTPAAAEKTPNPRGREYFYFVQPEVESRGKDVAGNSTTIQALMALAHGMRRRTGNEGGFRSLAFLDSVDKLRRLHAAYDDAESQKGLAAYRTRLYPDDPVTGGPRDACCGKPFGCDLFVDGECWLFAATDQKQVGSKGQTRPGRPLRVAPQPVFSGSEGRVEDLLKQSDIIFTTSSLEVGYDDPDISLVYQHYAPRNLASFIQRKGRGGRGSDDRPITAVTLSLYNSRDTWWFRQPGEMISPTGFDTPLNPDNHFVIRGQLVTVLLDAFARHARRIGRDFDPSAPSAAALVEAESLAEAVFGATPWRQFSADTLESFWRQARTASLSPPRTSKLPDVRRALPWAPDALFDTINLPVLEVAAGSDAARPEDIALALFLAAPGNASRRYNPVEIYWRKPVQGRHPWLAHDDYALGKRRRPFGDDPEAWLSRLPDTARPLLENLSPDYFRPGRMSLEVLGRKHGADWQADWAVPDPLTPQVEAVRGDDHRTLRIRDDARGFLRGFPVVKASDAPAQTLTSDNIARWVSGVHAYLGNGLGGRETGLTLARVFWGADAELNLEGPPSQTVAITQIFTGPDDERPMLHGYHVQTEGVRFAIDPAALSKFVAEEISRLERDPQQRQWRLGQMLRFLLESGAQAAGISTFEARRLSEILITTHAEPDLRQRLARLAAFWSTTSLVELLEETRSRRLSHHPLLTVDRVQRLTATLSLPSFRTVFQAAMKSLQSPERLEAYVASCLLHGLGNRLRESFQQVGFGDERQIVMHVQLPIQFAEPGPPIITVCESGAFGDGTTRAYLGRYQIAEAHWTDGFVASCPNAREDAAVSALVAATDRHAEWRALDPAQPGVLEGLAADLDLPAGEAAPEIVLRILFGIERVGVEAFALYDIAMAMAAIDHDLSGIFGRPPSAWELTSAVVEAAKSEPTSIGGRLLAAYAAIENSVQDESLSAEGRLADQVFRLHGRLCFDGCPACVHRPSDMMSDSLVESSTSRGMLGRFICVAS